MKVATADGTGNDYQYKQEYVAFIEGDDDASFGLSSTLPAGSQTIYLNFEVQLELPDNLPSNRTLVAWIGLGHDASFSSDNDVLFGIGLDPENALVKVREQSMAETATSFASELSRAAARVSLEITTPVGFRTSGEGELSYTYTVKVDFDRDGQTDFISTGSYMDSRWGVNLQLGLERWWSGAGSTAGEQPLRASLHVVGTTGMPDPTDPAAEALGLRSVASGTTATRIKIIWRSSATNVPRYIVQWRRTADQEFSDTERRAVIDCGTNCNSFPTKSYVITGLMAGTEYSIQVTTGILSGSIRTFTRPDIPENFQVTGRVGQITVAWNEVRGARFYRVQWVTGSESFEQDSPVYEEILMTPPARTAGDPPIRKFSASFDSGEEGGVLHKVRVAGVAANDLSGEWAGPLSAILLTLPSVRNLTLTPGDSILTVTWDPPEGGYPPGQSVSVQFYQVSYRPVGSNAWRSGLQVLNRKVIQGLTNGREYEVRIRAFIIPTGVITAGPLTATPAVPPFDPNKPRLPGIPRNLSLTAGDGWIQASWDPPDDLGNPPLHGYMVVYRRGAETNNAIWLWSNGTNTRFTIRGLTNGQKYVVGVLANSTLGLGPEAGALSATPQATGPSRPDSELPRPRPPSKPRNLSLVPGDGQIEVSWDEPLDRGEPDFRRYLVKYREVQQTEQTWEDWYSDWYCWLFSGCPPPGPEPDTTPKRWLEVGLYYDTDVLIEWLKNGTTYEVQVKVFNIHGEAVAGPKQATPQQQPEPVRRPGMPRNLTLTPADGSITVSWDPPAGTVPVDGYRVRYIRAKSSHFIGGSITTVKGTSTVLRGANGQYYSAKVAAYNSAGTGPETPAASAAPAPA